MNCQPVLNLLVLCVDSNGSIFKFSASHCLLIFCILLRLACHLVCATESSQSAAISCISSLRHANASVCGTPTPGAAIMLGLNSVALFAIRPCIGVTAMGFVTLV